MSEEYNERSQAMILNAKTVTGEDIKIAHRDLGEIGDKAVSQFCICKFVTSIVPKEVDIKERLKNDCDLLIAAGVDLASVTFEDGEPAFHD